MFPEVVLFCLLGFTVVLVGFFFLKISFSETEISAYHRLLQDHTDSSDNPYVATQTRKGILKEAFLTEESQRLQFRIKGSLAELVADHREGKTEYREHMKKVICDKQEKLYYVLKDGREAYLQEDGRLLISHADPSQVESWISINDPGVAPMQLIRRLTAETATYHYSSDSLTTENSRIESYAVPGHVLVDHLESTPLMSGEAKWCQLSLKKRPIQLQAQELRVVFNSGQKPIGIQAAAVRCEDNVAFLTGKVKINHEEGCLFCEQATYEPQKQKITFKGRPEQDFVVYTSSQASNGSKQPLPFTIKSREMALLLEPSSPTSKDSIREITAEKNVSVNYGNEFQAFAEKAHFTKSPHGSSARDGILLLQAVEKGNCRICRGTNDTIVADAISIDTIEKRIDLTQAQGVLDSHEPKEIVFSADSLSWDEAKLVLTLSGNVIVDQKGIGKLNTGNEVRLFYQNKEGRKQLYKIESFKDTILTHVDKSKGESHVLNCHGSFIIDHERLHAVMESPCNEQGNVDEDQQVFFEDEKGEIFADKVIWKYNALNQMATPSQVILEGNVRIFNRFSPAAGETGTVLQYILADSAEYTPLTKEMIFKASPGNHILFFEKNNNLQVSAPALKIFRNEATKKDSIQGMGDVRFNFAEHELEQIRKRFSLYDKIKK